MFHRLFTSVVFFAVSLLNTSFANAWTNTASYSSQGLSLKYLISAPQAPTPSANRLPVVIFQEGDGTADRMKNDIFDPVSIAPQLEQVSKMSGYVFAIPELRRQHFHDNMLSLCQLDFFHREKDLSTFIDEIKKLSFVDPNRIFLIGHSAGAETVTRVAQSRLDIHGVINMAGGVVSCSEGGECPPQLNQLVRYSCIRNSSGGRDGIWWQQLFTQTSLFHDINSTSIPYLALIGEKDTVVSVSDSKDYSKRISKIKNNFEFQVIPGVDHGSIKTSQAAFGILFHFIGRNL